MDFRFDPNARAKIPGTTLVGIPDTGTHQIELHELTAGEQTFRLELLRSHKVPHADFLIARVTDAAGEKTFWEFKAEKFDGRGKIHCDPETEEYFILLLNHHLNPRHPILERIIPLADLPKATRSKVEETGDIVYVGGRWNPQQLIAVKERIARELGFGCAITKFEQSLRETMRRRQAAQEAALRAQQEADAQARREAQEARRQEIFSRPTITVWTVADGKKRWGIPVTEEEWETLPKDTGAVLVKKYPDDQLEVIEAFFVHKTPGGRCSKRAVAPVTLERPVKQFSGQTKARPEIQILRGFLVQMGKQEVYVAHVDKQNFNLMKVRGMNSGTLVALGEPDDKGRHQVHEFKDDGVYIIGMFAPL